MKLNDYKSSTLKIITLPSGIKARVNQVKIMSYVLSGSLPNIFNLNTGEVDFSQKGDLKETESMIENIILGCVDTLIFDDNEAFLVDKPAARCAENEVSYCDHLSNEDAMYIFTTAFSESMPSDGGLGNIKEFRSSTGK